MLNKEGVLFISIIVLFAVLYLAQLVAIGFFIHAKKHTIDTIIENN